MKKIIATILAASMVFGLMGCGTKTPAPAPAAPAATEEKAEEEAPAEEAAPAEESAPITLRIAHQSNEDEPIAKGFEAFKESIEAAGVNVTVEIFPAKQLVGSDADAIEACQLGEIDMTSCAEMQFAPFCPAFYVFNADYLFNGMADAKSELEGELGEALRQATLDANLGVEVAGFYGGSLRGIFTTKKALRVPADMNGVKMRTADNPINIAELEALGASAIIMAGGECYTGFQQGAIEGWISAMTSHVQQGYLDVCSYVADTWQTIYIPVILANSATLASMSDAQRAAYEEAVKAATELEWKMTSDQMDTLYEDLRAMDAEGTAHFSELTDEERAQWKEIMVGATEDMVKEKLGDYVYLLDMMRSR